MATNALGGLKVAILVTDGFEQVEMTEPRQALKEAGAVTRLVARSPRTTWRSVFTISSPTRRGRGFFVREP